MWKHGFRKDGTCREHQMTLTSMASPMEVSFSSLSLESPNCELSNQPWNIATYHELQAQAFVDCHWAFRAADNEAFRTWQAYVLQGRAKPVSSLTVKKDNVALFKNVEAKFTKTIAVSYWSCH